jgi:hypothetical protein
MVAGFHGNAPFVWLYINGPVAWFCRLATSDASYLWILGLTTGLVWIGYWCFMLVGTSRLTGFQRSAVVVSLHFASALAYHVIFGLD